MVAIVVSGINQNSQDEEDVGQDAQDAGQASCFRARSAPEGVDGRRGVSVLEGRAGCWLSACVVRLNESSDLLAVGSA
jgi:hypothetical protein